MKEYINNLLKVVHVSPSILDPHEQCAIDGGVAVELLANASGISFSRAHDDLDFMVLKNSKAWRELDMVPEIHMYEGLPSLQVGHEEIFSHSRVISLNNIELRVTHPAFLMANKLGFCSRLVESLRYKDQDDLGVLGQIAVAEDATNEWLELIHTTVDREDVDVVEENIFFGRYMGAEKLVNEMKKWMGLR